MNKPAAAVGFFRDKIFFRHILAQFVGQWPT
jgi:hypothetical protein